MNLLPLLKTKTLRIHFQIGLSSIGILSGYFSLAATPVPTPPPVIYHFGEKQYLRSDIQAKTIPQEEWDKYIVGSTTRFSLPPYRRGLYGSSSPGVAVAYGDELIGTGKMPWFMAIKIRKECREKPAILDFYPEEIWADPRFKDWTKSSLLPNFETFDKILNLCFPIAQGVADGSGLRLVNLSEYGVEKERPCDQMMERFLTDEKIRVVDDYAWESSWYIRDRSCIEDITGDENDLIQIMKNDPNFWDSNKLGDPLSEEADDDSIDPGSSYGPILLDALASTGFHRSDAKLILANLNQVKDKKDRFNFERKILESLLRCTSENRLPIYQLRTAKILNQILNDKKANHGHYYRSLEKKFSSELAHLCR